LGFPIKGVTDEIALGRVVGGSVKKRPLNDALALRILLVRNFSLD
jgi:hypothetical protein